MKEDRTAFWFRIRVILSTLLVLLGAGLFFAGYYGYAKKWGIPIEVSFFGSGGMIIAGFAIRATLFHCPFCGAHIYLRNPVLLYFYSCPSCGHSVGKGKASYLNRRLSTNSVHESKHSNVAHYRRKVIVIDEQFDSITFWLRHSDIYVPFCLKVAYIIKCDNTVDFQVKWQTCRQYAPGDKSDLYMLFAETMALLLKLFNEPVFVCEYNVKDLEPEINGAEKLPHKHSKGASKLCPKKLYS